MMEVGLEKIGDLQGAALKSMRSKPTLRILSSLMAKGLIEYDPFAGTAKHTESGLAVISGQ